MCFELRDPQNRIREVQLYIQRGFAQPAAGMGGAFKNGEERLKSQNGTQKVPEIHSWRGREGLLGPPGGLRGPLGRPPGGSWGVFFRGSVLGSIFDPKGGAQRSQKGTPKAPKMEPRGHPKRVKIEADFQERKKRALRPSWSRLGSILGGLGRRLGRPNTNFVLENVGREQNRRF